MPAINKPNAGDSAGSIPSNPTAGAFTVIDPFSGPKGSPMDAHSYDPTTRALVADPTNYSTGALNTGIGLSSLPIFTAKNDEQYGEVPSMVQPGLDLLDGNAIGNVAPTTPQPIVGDSAYTPYGQFGACLLCVGGGASAAASNGAAETTPLDAEVLCGFGNGIHRDDTAGKGIGIRKITASGDVSVGGVISTAVPGFSITNASGVALKSGDTVYAAAVPSVG